MPAVRELRPELRPLAETLRQKLPSLAAQPDAIIAERAPDERAVLAALLQLAELSPDLLATALQDSTIAGDLIFCLGASDLVRSELTAAGDRWIEIFREARSASVQ